MGRAAFLVEVALKIGLRIAGIIPCSGFFPPGLLFPDLACPKKIFLMICGKSHLPANLKGAMGGMDEVGLDKAKLEMLSLRPGIGKHHVNLA